MLDLEQYITGKLKKKNKKQNGTVQTLLADSKH